MVLNIKVHQVNMFLKHLCNKIGELPICKACVSRAEQNAEASNILH